METALVYDEEMTRYKLLWLDPDCEIERPERLTASHEALVRSGLAARCVSIPVRQATDADILLIHSEEYLEAVKKTPYMTLEDLREFTLQYGAVYFHPNSYHCATLAVGAALQLVDGVMTGRVRNGIALVRPPGHHSMRSAASGFCVFNNVAIAAKYAQQKYGIQRVLIVDWDIHHGQGVQYAFEDDPSVLYLSWHRYEHQKFWPELRESDYDSVGKDKGAGFNINVPWNKVGMQNVDYLAVFCHVLLPVAYEFCPDLVLVCAGFDSAIGDPEGEMCATPDIFAHLTHLLMNLAGGKLCAVLEFKLCSDIQRPGPLTCKAPVRAHSSPFSVFAQLIGSTGPASNMQLKHPPQTSARSASSWKKKEEKKSCKGEKQLEDFDDDAVMSSLTALVGKMENNEICNGLALVGDISMVMAPVIRHATALKQRVLVVCVGGTGILSHLPEDGTALAVHVSKEAPEEPQLKHYIPVRLKNGCGHTSGLAQVTFGLLLPLAYEYDPALVLLARMPGTDGASDCAWQQLVGLLQGLARGRMLVLIQRDDKALVSPTLASLSGSPSPCLGRLPAPLAEDVEALERLRRRLQVDWMLLRTSAQKSGGEDN
ncbi:polyamine deacetylase HDAC10 isoform X5 [Phycodurus eques]|uniref:polyamine deacetylase HDAC10 isoform X5 n=1 Tax=Phycodurus eques TaxID=693459 RepID=UPI002ACE6E11|nr:polyamine deacetylase HDAC10 isoform X5 [Phycodurus eques]